jgi:hypothetical protein
MHLCPTSILAATFTFCLIIADVVYENHTVVIPHLFLGGLVSLLFFGLCQFGYEILNWGFIGIFPVFVFILWLSRSMTGTAKSSTTNLNSMPDFGNCSNCGIVNACDTPTCSS